MKKSILLITLIASVLLNHCLCAQDTLVKKRNIVYLMPTSIGGDLFWDLDNLWVEAGYCRRLNKQTNQFIDFKIGIIIYSRPVKGDLLSDINAKNTKGFNLNLEHKLILIKKLYYSTNIFYQNTVTIRDGEIDNQKNKYLNDNNYKVIRNVYCVQPKIGFHFINKKNNIYTDVGLGIGIRYIQSHSINKINTAINSGYETFANKEFDKGSKFAQKFSFQIKIGYNF